MIAIYCRILPAGLENTLLGDAAVDTAAGTMTKRGHQVRDSAMWSLIRFMALKCHRVLWQASARARLSSFVVP